MTVPASVSVSLTPVLIVKNDKSFTISLRVTGDGKNADKKLTITTLIDSGAQGKFLDKKLALKENWALTNSSSQSSLETLMELRTEPDSLNVPPG